VALVAALAAGAAGRSATAPVRLQITFTGSAQGHLADTERWTSLTLNQCVLRRNRDETATVSWSLSWRGAPGGRVAQAAPPRSTGNVAGTEVRDSCDIAPTALPADAPQDWLLSVSCNDPLQAGGGGALTLSQSASKLIVGVTTPDYTVSPDATCDANPRSDQLRARVPISTATIAHLKKGGSLSFTVGSAVTRFGTYVPQLNCMHSAKPYDGYRSYDQCLDVLGWSGTIVVTRL